ncbi:MAG: helix-turn-helix domain-containing protein [Actinomycetota bacterium]
MSYRLSDLVMRVTFPRRKPTSPQSRKLVMWSLAGRANDDGTSARPAKSTIAQEASLSPRQVGRVLAGLVEDGFLEVEADATHNRPTTYRVVVEAVTALGEGGHDVAPEPGTEGGHDVTPEGGHHDTPEPAGVTPDVTPGRTPHVTPGVTPDVHRLGQTLDPTLDPARGDARDEGTEVTPQLALVTEQAPATKVSFDEMWALYPRRHARAAAEKAWGKCTPAEQRSAVEFLAAAGPVIAATDPAVMRARRQFIPHGATWINQRRWTDEITPVEQAHEWMGTTPQRPDPRQPQPGRVVSPLRAPTAEVVFSDEDLAGGSSW